MLIPAGYFLKYTTVPTGWNFNGAVRAICSVSECIASGPRGWIDQWLHNELGFFDTVERAEAAAAKAESGLRLFAYRIHPERFANGSSEQFPTPELSVAPEPSGFQSLGFDVVSKSISNGFECSPLSCNGMAEEVAVNGYCLLESFEQAVSFAIRCSVEQPEPGDYYILEVRSDRA